jgi:hypothetical protein
MAGLLDSTVISKYYILVICFLVGLHTVDGLNMVGRILVLRW